jgi:hypothetical protein
MIEHGMNTEQTEDAAPAGWYPDMTDSGLMRYWDGFHFTGQTTPVEPLDDEPAGMPKMSKPGDPASAAGPASSVATPGPGRPQVALLADEFQPREADTADASPVRPVGWNSQGHTDPNGTPLNAVQALEAALTDTPVPAPASRAHDTWTSLREVGEVTDKTDPTEVDLAASGPAIEPVEASKDAESDVDDDTTAPASSTAAAPPTRDPDPTQLEQSATWARKLERAVATAQQESTPEAWREVAETAAVVEELAQTMVVAAAAAQASEETSAAAAQAGREAEAATRKAAEADQRAKRAAGVAEQAEAASKAAAKAAAEATRSAEQTAQVAPRMAETAKTAALAAEHALDKSRGIEAIVAKAQQADTAEAWSEAHRRVAEAMS